MNEPEFATVETFVQFLMDDERESFTPGDAQKVAQRTGAKLSDITAQLKSYGFKCEIRAKAPEGRGFTANDHDKYTEKNGFIGGCGIGGTSRHMVSHWQPK